jgi:hypothetical protein
MCVRVCVCVCVFVCVYVGGVAVCMQAQFVSLDTFVMILARICIAGVVRCTAKIISIHKLSNSLCWRCILYRQVPYPYKRCRLTASFF